MKPLENTPPGRKRPGEKKLTKGEEAGEFFQPPEKYRGEVEDCTDLFPLAYMSLNNEGLITAANQALLDLLGCQREEAIGHWFGFFITPQKVTLFREHFPRFLTVGEVHRDFEVVRKDGKIIAIAFDGKSSRDENGNINQIHCILKDITERKAVETRLRYQTNLLQNVSDAVIALNPDFIITDWNKAAQEIYGWERYEVEGKKIREVLDPDFLEINPQALYQEISEKGFWVGENRQRKKDGALIYAHTSISRVLDENDNLYGYVTINRDITEKRKIEEDARLYRDRLLMAQRISHVGSWEYNFTAQKIWGSEEGFRIFGLPPIAGEVPVEMIEDCIVEREAAHQVLLGLINEGKKYDLSYTVNPANGGKQKIVHSVAELVRDPGGQPSKAVGVVIDVTERTQAERDLKKSEELYRVLTETMKDVVWILDTETICFRYVSPSVKLLRGFTVEEVLSKPLDYALTPDEQTRIHSLIKERVNAFLSGQEPPSKYYVDEVEQPRKDGSTVWTEVVTNYYINPENQRVEVRGVTRDISARKLVENALRKSERRFRAIFEQAAVGMARVLSKTGAILDVNQKFCEMVGYTHDEASLLTFMDITHPDDTPRQVYLMEQLIAGKIPWFSMEKRYFRKDGQMIWVNLTISPVWMEGEEPVTHIAVVEDISDRKRDEAIIHQKDELLHLTGEMAQIGGWEFDTQTHAGAWTDEISRIYDMDYQGESSLEESLTLYQGESRDKLKKALYAAIQQALPYELELEIISAKNIHKWVKAVGRPVVENGKVVKLRGMIQDITELKQAGDKITRLNTELEQRVKERTAQLEAANKELEAFAYSVSHDLRAPLRTIDGFSQILLEEMGDKLGEQGQHYLERVRLSSQRMAILIDDLLNLSRITRSEMGKNKINLSKIVETVAKELQESQPTRQVEWVIAPKVTAYGDGRLLEVVIRNLLNNAFKFTAHHPTGRIEFGITKQDKKTVYFVRDDGAGFDMAYSHKLFTVFQRLHSSETFEGTGVGLAIVQRIIHRHGGQVWAEGAVEQGATFYFTMD